MDRQSSRRPSCRSGCKFLVSQVDYLLRTHLYGSFSVTNSIPAPFPRPSGVLFSLTRPLARAISSCSTHRPRSQPHRPCPVSEIRVTMSGHSERSLPRFARQTKSKACPERRSRKRPQSNGNLHWFFNELKSHHPGLDIANASISPQPQRSRPVCPPTPQRTALGAKPPVNPPSRLSTIDTWHPNADHSVDCFSLSSLPVTQNRLRIKLTNWLVKYTPPPPFAILSVDFFAASF